MRPASRRRADEPRPSPPSPVAPQSPGSASDRLRGHVDALLLAAMDHVASSRLAELTRSLLPVTPPWEDEADNVLALADAMAMAILLAVFTPATSGATALDRLARARPPSTAEEATALAALQRSRMRLLRVEAPSAGGVARLRDLLSGETVLVLDDTLGPHTVGVAVLVRLVPAGEERSVFVGAVTPLDEAALAVAQRFVRPGRPELLTPLRCAEAVFRHVLHHGGPEVPGLNRPFPGTAGEPPDEEDPLDAIAALWSGPDALRDPEDVRFVRAETSLDALVDMLASVAGTRMHGLAALSGGYAAIALLQLEVLGRRAAVGSGTVTLETVAAAVEAGIAAGELPPGTRTALAEARRALGAATPAAGAGAREGELDRVIGRIQALRAKTVAQGCTEAEALAAAAKVAELLDRYGLDLGERELRAQSCEGAPVETARRRAGPLDDCVPAVAGFFDCRVWGEKSPAGTLRYVFFGLPADVAGARYLYDLVEAAFATETALFRAGANYAAMPSGMRRTATNSFQIGLGRGIAAKLHTLREAREGALRTAAGRDLVVAKADVIEAELAGLGLQLRARSRSRGARVLREQYEQGRQAGLGFSYTPGLERGGQRA